jgi:hypothetical protein
MRYQLQKQTNTGKHSPQIYTKRTSWMHKTTKETGSDDPNVQTAEIHTEKTTQNEEKRTTAMKTKTKNKVDNQGQLTNLMDPTTSMVDGAMVYSMG